ncbi:MAG: TetR/AcrR family transcriptional regulator [Chloroflexi bacterium]|nr:MAG: TetR/AcrR family transcriptional regulator [Chloroflexota bacterium]
MSCDRQRLERRALPDSPNDGAGRTSDGMPPRRRLARLERWPDLAASTEFGCSGACLARAAQVTKPTVYYYFSDKSALFTEVVCSVLEEHGAGLKTAARRGGRARERLVSALAYLVGARCSGPRLLREGGVSLTVDQTSQARSAFFRHFFSPLQQILDEGVAAGELRQLDTAFATQALLNLLDPWTGRDPLPGGRSPQQLASDLVGLVVDGIGV